LSRDIYLGSLECVTLQHGSVDPLYDAFLAIIRLNSLVVVDMEIGFKDNM